MNPLAGNPYPVAIISDGITVTDVIGLDAATVVPARLMSPENYLTINGTGVSAAIDKRGWSCVGVYIPVGFSGTRLCVQVSPTANPAQWAYFIDSTAGTPWYATLYAGNPNGVLIDAEIFPFPFIRLVFTNNTFVVQNQTNLTVIYSMIA